MDGAAIYKEKVSDPSCPFGFYSYQRIGAWTWKQSIDSGIRTNPIGSHLLCKAVT